jgi:transcriptional regulator GlxA family with amidase domain
MIRSVVAVVHEKTGAFSLGVATEFFGYDRSELGIPKFEFALAGLEPGPLATDFGLTMLVEHGIEKVREADLVVVLPWDGEYVDPPAELVAELRAAYDRGAILMSFCSGTYLLAAAGLLDGRRATTHWNWVDRLTERYPAVTLDPDVLYVDEGRILTGAGGASGVDLCLYLLRREYGAKAANAVARSLVVPPHRDGGQAQYIVSPLPEVGDSERLGDVLAWMREHLGEQVTVDDLAARALMSPRSFARHFRAVTGTTPRAWLLTQRLHRAEELLETGDVPIEEIARQVGFGTAAALREQFVRRRGVAPRDYRRVFRAAACDERACDDRAAAPVTERAAG